MGTRPTGSGCPQSKRSSIPTLNLGTLEDLTLVRYDNVHEDIKGHEHHTAAGDVDDVAFPGMAERLLEFWASADEYWDAVNGGPERPY